MSLMQEIKREEYGRYGLSLLSLAAKTEHSSIDDQAALSPSSVHTSSSGAASSESQAPSFTESPPSSETSAGEYGDSEGTSRTSCSENIPGSLRVSIYDLDDAIITHAEVDGHKFDYHKISPDLIPEGWSNNPKDLEPFGRTLNTDEYDLVGVSHPLLAFKGDGHASRYLFSVLGRFYFWVPASSEALYVTQTYRLRGVLQHIHKNSVGLRTRTLESLTHWYSQHEITHLPLCFEDIPSGWWQNTKHIRDIKDLVDVHEYGLPLPVLILQSDDDDYFMKCGDRYYFYNEIGWCNLRRVEEPTELSQILRALGQQKWEGIRLTECDPLPEYGGPYKLSDEDVPHGWSKQIDEGVCEKGLFDRHGILIPLLMLFHEADRGLPALYLVHGVNPCKFYIWDIVSNKISRIEQPDTLQDIMDALNTSLDELTLSHVEPRCRV